MRMLPLFLFAVVAASVLAALSAGATSGVPREPIAPVRAQAAATTTPGRRPERNTSPSTFAMGAVALAAVAALQWRRRRLLAESAAF